MKNRNIVISFSILAVTFILWVTYPWVISAGGVGSIAQYSFKVSKYELEEKLKQVIKDSPNIGFPNDPKYDLEGTGYEDECTYMYFVNEKDTFIFRYKFSGDSSYWEKKTSESIIALTHVGYYGQTPLKTNRDLFFFQKPKWEIEFEKILARLKIPYQKE